MCDGCGSAVAVVNWFVAGFYRVERCSVVGMTDIDEHSEFVHAFHGVVSEIRETRVLIRLFHAAAEHV